MAVTVNAELVATFSGETRPPGHAGWNNPVGDPTWIKDVDWFRRVRLSCTGPEVGSIVNWEIFDDTVPLKTTAQINALADGASGPLINNTTTWTVWAYTGVNTAGKAYRDTKTGLVSTLRANLPVVQVLLGNRPAKPPAKTYTVYAFLPGGGKTPAGSKTIAVTPPSVTITPDGGSIVVTGTLDLNAAVAPAQAPQTVTWASSDSGVAMVNANGLVSGGSPGTATITATSTTFAGVSDTCTVTVTSPLQREVEAAEEPAEEEIVATPDPEPKPRRGRKH